METPLSQEKIDALVATAYEAQKKAYAPWSNFKVGAALLTKKDDIFEGANIESKLFTPTTHAERLALSNGYLAGNRPGDYAALAVVCPQKDGTPAFPCGICREDIEELSGDIYIIAENSVSKKRTSAFLKDLLPNVFHL